MHGFLRRPATATCALAAAAAWFGASCARAQSATPQVSVQPDAPPAYTLHVYNTLVQFAAVVLDSDLKPVQPIPRTRFSISLDGGAPFPPTQTHQEGNDPIELAVLLDAGGSQTDLLARFPEAFASLFPAFLHTNDHISIYAEDCKLVRSLRSAPANAALARAAIAAALAIPTLHGGKAKGACGHALPQWDNLALIAHDLASEPGRRVILLLSGGDARGSRLTLAESSLTVATQGVAVFQMYDPEETTATAPGRAYTGTGLSLGAPGNTMRFYCGNTGGMDIPVHERDLARKLQHVVMLLRERYIVEFPRPTGHIAGQHDITITVAGKPYYFIRNTGATTPLPDAAQAGDPNTVPSAVSPATIGTRPSR